MAGKPTPRDHKQRQAILGELDCNLMVEAAAGTGKTTSLLGRMVALIESGRCSVHTLAAVTFTRKAASELRSRFLLALEKRAGNTTGEARIRIDRAISGTQHCFIGTIHSFCARLLRERPVEARVDLSFREMEEAENRALMQVAWEEFEAALYAEADPALEELDSLGLNISQLEETFRVLADHTDIQEWPAGSSAGLNVGSVLEELRKYTDYMRSLELPPPPRSSRDRLIPAYRRIPWVLEAMGDDAADPVRITDLLAEFKYYERPAVVQRDWPGSTSAEKKELAVGEQERWNRFAREVAEPAIRKWREHRYRFAIRIAERAVSRYRSLREDTGSLNFQDLLLKSAELLRNHPQVRSFFRRRFSHILVDEFQDTDPVQAEVMMLLTSDDPKETNWKKCRPTPGSLFVVGDPKQSIFRFRRADITTYNDMKQIIAKSGGTCYELFTNFRTVEPNIAWINRVFSIILPDAPSDTSPRHVPLEVGRTDGSVSGISGIRIIQIPDSCRTTAQCVDYEADFIARYIRSAMDDKQKIPRPSASPSPAQPGDFLIVARTRRHLGDYARALQDLGIPNSVTGGSVLNDARELRLLHICLMAALRPYSTSAVAGALRSSLFGISDDTLYNFTRAGGAFTPPFSIPGSMKGREKELLKEAFSRLERYRRWLDVLVPVAAIEMIIDDLGLKVSAAVEPGGNVLAGSIGKALDLIRSARKTNFTASGLVDFLGYIIDKEEPYDGVPALLPREEGVRIMNLHKVKGLEAPVVFLADPTGKREFPVTRHIDRTRDASAGYMAVYGAASGWASPPLLAQPAGWEEKWAPREKAFAEAEEARLLYVAATRAGAQLIITQRLKGNEKNYWSPFADYLTDYPVLEDPGPVVGPAEKPATLSEDEVPHAVAAVERNLAAAVKPTYLRTSVTDTVKEDAQFSIPRGEHGTEWGTVMHILLEAAMADPDTDLHSLAQNCLADKGLDPSLAGPAAESVGRVMGSPLWNRAAEARKRLVEVPFSLAGEQAGENGKMLPSLITGVIDLVFEEPDGWVLVDYKTGGMMKKDADRLARHYRPQIKMYSDCWEKITGQVVKEVGFYFVDLGVYLPLV